MRRGAGGIGTSAERARRVGRALGSNRFPFENHRRIRVACVRGTPGPRAARGIGIGHAPRPRRPPAFPAQRPRAAIEGARHPSTEASRTGPPWCATSTPHADGAAAVHCGGELTKLYDRRSAPRRGCSPAARGGLSLALRIQPLTPRPCRYRPPRHREGGCVRTRQPAMGPARLRRADQ